MLFFPVTVKKGGSHALFAPLHNSCTFTDRDLGHHRRLRGALTAENEQPAKEPWVASPPTAHPCDVNFDSAHASHRPKSSITRHRRYECMSVEGLRQTWGIVCKDTERASPMDELVPALLRLSGPPAAPARLVWGFGPERRAAKGHEPSQGAPTSLLRVAMNFGSLFKEGRSRIREMTVGWGGLTFGCFPTNPSFSAKNLTTRYIFFSFSSPAETKRPLFPRGLPRCLRDGVPFPSIPSRACSGTFSGSRCLFSNRPLALQSAGWCPPRGRLLGRRVGVAFLLWPEFWAAVSEPPSRPEIPAYLTTAVKHKEFQK